MFLQTTKIINLTRQKKFFYVYNFVPKRIANKAETKANNKAIKIWVVVIMC